MSARSLVTEVAEEHYDRTVEAYRCMSDRYIYMNGVLPSIAQIGAATERLLTMEDWHNFGYDYFLTLTAWYENFRDKWDGPHDEAFCRMWKYFLLCSAGQFLARSHQLWQVMLAKTGVPQGYEIVR